jgi:hypothetical protein
VLFENVSEDPISLQCDRAWLCLTMDHQNVILMTWPDICLVTVWLRTETMVYLYCVVVEVLVARIIIGG